MSSWRRTALGSSLIILMLGMGLFAERAFVTNLGGMTVNIFDTTATPGAGSLETTITVGVGPVDIASDQPDTVGPTKLFVCNSGSDTVSVIDPVLNTAYGTITGGTLFGSFDVPGGICLMRDSRPVPLFQPSMVVVDQQVTPPSYGGTGRSTIRFISPVSHNVVDAFREASPSSRFTDVVWTNNRRLWVSDRGDKGVTVVRFSSTITGPPFGMGNTLIYQGTAEFSDFVRDTATTPTFLVNPIRLATDGSDYVVVADGGSAVVTILDANYPVSNQVGEPGAILANIDLSVVVPALPAGTTVSDVEVSGGFAYASTTNSSATPNLHRINLATQTYMGSIPVGVAPDFIAGLGATADGTTLYAGCAVMDDLYHIDLGTFTETPPEWTFASGTMPFGFYSSSPNANPPSTPVSGNSGAGAGGVTPPLNNVNTKSSSKDESVFSCGLLGIEFLFVLLGLGLLRRRA